MGEDGGGAPSGGHGGAGGGAGVAHAGNGEVGAPHAPTDHGHGGKNHGNQNNDVNISSHEITRPISPPSRETTTPNPFSRKNTSIDLDDYFSGPRDIAKHSKWPLFLQLHGSITPKMIVPLVAIGAWATLITVLSKEFESIELSIEPVLLTITGFVVSMGLSLRSSTAYERYAEGRRCWSQLILASQSLGRVFWVHAIERPETAKEDLLGKLTAMNLVIAFAVALKHKLRFEPYTHYEDLVDLVGHIDTLAKQATEDEEVTVSRKYTIFKAMGENLGLSFATSNPRKMLKRSKKPVGNLPLEILCYLTAYADELVANGQLPVGMQQTTVYNNLGLLNDVLVNTERVLNTPLPIAYAIVISQITWLYVVLLPFQLYASLSWITIPATIFASYIILGIFFIGHEIENPFGNDVNDLPLGSFCQQIVEDMETISSRTKISTHQLVQNSRNKVLYPYSQSNYYSWAAQSEGSIRAALKNRPNAYYEKAQAPSTASGADNV
ncbi:Bestrophin, RFP-TM, chloride channel-domain-containing protein [Xylaria sp. FL1777]|nr:Bestrophin, RFP-TM, chloride channel-domain-containing protein [Xylaria sp. FL1777]